MLRTNAVLKLYKNHDNKFGINCFFHGMEITVDGTSLKFNKILYSNKILRPSLNTVFMIIYHKRKKKDGSTINAFHNIFAYYVNIRHYFALLLDAILLRKTTLSS